MALPPLRLMETGRLGYSDFVWPSPAVVMEAGHSAKIRPVFTRSMSCPTASKHQVDPKHHVLPDSTNFYGINRSSPPEGRLSVQTHSPGGLSGKLKLEPLVSARLGMHLNLTEHDSKIKSGSLGDDPDDEGNLLPWSVQNTSRASADKRKKKRKIAVRQRRDTSNSSNASNTCPALGHHLPAAGTRKERMVAYEAQRMRDVAKHDRRLNSLLQVRALSPSPDQQLCIAQRRAAYEAQRQANRKMHAQRVQEAKMLVRERLEESQHPDAFIKRVIVLVLSAANLDSDECSVGCDVNENMFEQCCQKANIEFYGHRIETVLLSQGMRSKKCCEDIVNLLVKKYHANELSQAAGQNFSAIIAEAVKHLNETGSPDWMCPICTDPLVSISANYDLDLRNIWYAPQRKNEHWSNHACGHTFCRSCMEQWAETAVSELKVRIKCPAEHCSFSLWEQDLQELLSTTMFNRYKKLKHADYLQNLQAVAEKDDNFMRWLRLHARPCPSCHVIVSRSEGCNTMTCVCGTRFCYACGCLPCQCTASLKKRADIWRPDA
mmetsp:Transcript_31961/g.62873  ORF Transcript_31961/g.62873 Transcript_31961/m.62873 type:complete len:547 (-) Transcript_31961:269-1909(-)